MARVLNDYKRELRYANKLKAEGQKEVAESTAGSKLAAGREFVPIDEYIESWKLGIIAMENGAPEADFDY